MVLFQATCVQSVKHLPWVAKKLSVLVEIKMLLMQFLNPYSYVDGAFSITPYTIHLTEYVCVLYLHSIY